MVVAVARLPTDQRGTTLVLPVDVGMRLSDHFSCVSDHLSLAWLATGDNAPIRANSVDNWELVNGADDAAPIIFRAALDAGDHSHEEIGQLRRGWIRIGHNSSGVARRDAGFILQHFEHRMNFGEVDRGNLRFRPSEGSAKPFCKLGHPATMRDHG